MTTIVLVEGESDRVALEIVATRLGLPIPAIVVLGGAHAAAKTAAALRDAHRLVGLVDAGERDAFAGVADVVFACERDLEDELVRALGVEAVLAIIARQGELESFRTLQKQPAQRDRTIMDQLRRFLHGRSGNKARYAALFVEAIPPERIPPPLRDVVLVATKP